MSKVWKVKHWISASSYVPHEADAQWLPTEYELGRRQIRDHVMKIASSSDTSTTNNTLTKVYNIAEVLPFIHESETVQAVKQYLPADGNLLVWGFTETDSPALHMATSGRVMFLGDVDPSRVMAHNTMKIPLNDYVYRSFPFLAHNNAVFKTPRGDWSTTVRTYLTGQSYETNTNWCDLLVPLFPRHLFDTAWDVILVQDQRNVNGTVAGAGILQPLFNTMVIIAKQMAGTNGTAAPKLPHIIVNDFHRQFEQDVTRQIFGRAPDATLRGDVGNSAMAVYSIRNDDPSYSWAFDCPKPLLRLPRLYVGPWSRPDVTKLVDLIPPTANVLWLGMQNHPRFWHYASSGEVLFLENIQNTTEITKFTSEYPEVSILPVNFTSHDVPADRLAATDWNVLVVHPYVRDRIPFLEEVDRLKSRLLKRDMIVIVGDYQIPYVANRAHQIFGARPINVIVKGPKKIQQRIAIFRIE
jgi:hypothetical protein